MKLLLAYFRARWRGLVLLPAFALIFGMVFALYDLPVEAVGYSALLCAAVAVPFAIVDLIRFRRRHRLLSGLLQQITLTVDCLPASGQLLEQDYQALIRAVHRDKSAVISQLDRKTSDMLDYYTLWAHQIKTPIAAMHLLLQSETGEQGEELNQELFKIEQYVEMVLQYLRLDSDSTDFVLRSCDLDAIVRQAVRKYAEMFIRRHIRLDYQPLGVSVLTDEKWLLFVIEQLLSNALKYTTKGTIFITLEENTTLVIRDTGIGIQAEDLPRVFEKGFTGYNGRIDKKSTGIGLFLCRKICDKLGHSLTIQSQVNQGTAVYVGLASEKFQYE